LGSFAARGIEKNFHTDCERGEGRESGRV